MNTPDTTKNPPVKLPVASLIRPITTGMRAPPILPIMPIRPMAPGALLGERYDCGIVQKTAWVLYTPTFAIMKPKIMIAGPGANAATQSLMQPAAWYRSHRQIAPPACPNGGSIPSCRPGQGPPCGPAGGRRPWGRSRHPLAEVASHSPNWVNSCLTPRSEDPL